MCIRDSFNHRPAKVKNNVLNQQLAGFDLSLIHILLIVEQVQCIGSIHLIRSRRYCRKGFDRGAKWLMGNVRGHGREGIRH